MQKQRNGFVTIYMVFAMMTLIPIVGLAIDFSILYNMKARLQRAADAGAIGAGSMVQRSTDVTDPTQNAALQSAVQRFFNANLRPVPWNTTQTSYAASITQDSSTKVRTIQVDATYRIPMLFMRVLGINASNVSVRSIAKIRFVNMMVVVDRSGSVQRTGTSSGPNGTNPTVIKNALNSFIGNSSTSIFVNGRDVVGLLSFGGNYNLDFSPTTNFQTSSPNISNAINAMVFDTNNSTNTGEGLYQAWYQLTQLNQTGALNVILLITDGRPSAFTASFPVKASSTCQSKTNKAGFISSPVGIPFPPPTDRGTSGVFKVTPIPPSGTLENATSNTVANTNCAYASNVGNMSNDISTIPTMIGPITNTTGTFVPAVTSFPSQSGYFSGGGTATNNAVSVRYAAFNYADNVATAIRQDNTYKPVIYSIGLNFDTTTYNTEEPLDADWLARVANDPGYKSPSTGRGVYQTGQTSGKYYNVTYNGLAAALQDITGQILRLSAN